MRLDHIAYRVKNRAETAKFFIDALGYHVQQEFSIDFDDGTKAQCIALEPPEKTWQEMSFTTDAADAGCVPAVSIYHLAPEIFVSDGPPGSIVGDWVAARNGIGGIHHLAYQVNSVAETMEEWKQKGYAEFSTDAPIKCPGLTQVFTKPSALTGVIYEFIERGEHGFCAENVKNLMLATAENNEVK